MRKKLLITDLDNTLYDWVTFFSASFTAMVEELVRITGIDRDIILDDFRTVHRRHHNSEYPFAVMELPSLRARYAGLSDQELLKAIDEALHAFNRVRHEKLALYESVADTLEELRRRDVRIVGHTEAIAANAYFRLKKLGIAGLFDHLYVLESSLGVHPRGASEVPPPNLVAEIPYAERKPNPRLLLDICRRNGVSVDRAVYIGDSKTRDVSMAKNAGVSSVWARYGTRYDSECWRVLVRVTHWTDEDVRREEELRSEFAGLAPDFTADRFADLLPVMED